ncbi:disulfide bond formation protein B [Aliiroseovarius subalbicans]|uniref:disulfide bond formation protein B n=1 Tax=Aliiroseovarius subalbicans TaxID=2925840 RepID=UPI001F5A1EFE|nr:disulfide bond formation protein B [Aliiroseovarius subalbicans]MCI2398314.1 disulfide bond formation protein B [Aliiroseovarius subalbicans]
MTFNRLVLFAALAAAAMLAGAFMFQAAGYVPCQMCFWQRWPHGIAAALGLIAVLTQLRGVAWLGALTMTISAGLGAYHTGVERHWWPGPASCTGGDVSGVSADDLLNQILSAPLVRCDEIPWRLSDWIPLDILDLTMANFNAVGSLVLVGVWIAAARR